jgi:hypothetical protein
MGEVGHAVEGGVGRGLHESADLDEGRTAITTGSRLSLINIPNGKQSGGEA